jgi:hypothetical protein
MVCYCRSATQNVCLGSHGITPADYRVAGIGISNSQVAAERDVAMAHSHFTINLMKLIHFFLVKKAYYIKRQGFFQ